MKEQWVKTTRGSIYAAIVFAVIDSVETEFDEDFDLFEVGVPGYLLSPAETLAAASGGTLEVRISVPGRRGELGAAELSDGGLEVRVVSDPECACEASLRSLYAEAPARVIQADAPIIREGAMATARSGTEYMYLYTDKGVLAALEGDVGFVRIPFVRVAMSIHTHPPGACGLSLADVHSGLDLLSEGGLAEAAATTKCAYIMRREGLVLEDDYIALRSLRGRRGDPFNPSRHPLKSIRFEVVYY